MNDLKFADVLVFKIDPDSTISILLGTRTNEKNFSGKQCIPGGHLKVGENAKYGAIRELKEETNLDISPLIDNLKQVSVYNADPNIVKLEREKLKSASSKLQKVDELLKSLS